MQALNDPATYVISNELGRGNELSDQEYFAWLERDPCLEPEQDRQISKLMARSPWVETVCQEFRECAPKVTSELSAEERARMEDVWTRVTGREKDGSSS